MTPDNQIVLFEEKKIRRTWHEGEWFFSVIDVIEVLTESPRARKYWNSLKKKLTDEGFFQLSQKLGQLKMTASDGKDRATDVANRQTLLRIIMSVPSPKAEPFRQWLAQVGEERILEIENPELAIERARDIYRAKGYPDEWIETRIKSIETRKELTDEWKSRNVKEGQEYSILTAEIAKATFGVTPTEHKELKKLEKENLRDHMTKLELIFTMLGEEATRRIAVQDDAQNFHENYEAAQKGGRAAGGARDNFEKLSNQKVVSKDNFLNQIKSTEKPILPEDTTTTE
jgi:DNA-damage-inducible protein D